jgi:hypothetical protein
MPSLNSIQSIRDHYESEFISSVQGEVREAMLKIFVAKLNEQFDAVVDHYRQIDGRQISRSEFCSTIRIGGKKDHLRETYEGTYDEIDRVTVEFTAEVYSLRNRIIQALAGHYSDLNKKAIVEAGTDVFLAGNYSPFASPEALAETTMNQKVGRVNRKNFPNIVASLPVPDVSEERKREYLERLKAEKITDLHVFFLKGSALFQAGVFDDILPRNMLFGSHREKLVYVADFLGLGQITPSVEKGALKRYLNQLGIFSITAFKRFAKIHANEKNIIPVYGDFKGLMNSFDDMSTSKVDNDGRAYIAHELSLDSDETAQMQFYTKILTANVDIRGGSDIVKIRKAFLSASFFPYANPKEFATFVLDRSIGERVTRAIVQEVVNKLLGVDHTDGKEAALEEPVVAGNDEMKNEEEPVIACDAKGELFVLIF